MYRFVCSYDYASLIKDQVKTMVTDGNDQMRLRAEQFAREEMEGYLNTEYNVSRILNFMVYDYAAGQSRKKGDLVIQPDGTTYVCILDDANTDNLEDVLKFVKDDLSTIKQYDATTAYVKGQTIIGSDSVKYLCIKDAAAGTSLYDPEYFFTKRHDLMVMLYCDIAIYHYHARINPNQIPQIRIDRYMDAKSTLKQIRRKELTPTIPRTDTNADGEPDTGAIVMISNKKRQNQWSE